MTLEQADSLFRAYAELLADEECRGCRRSPSLLPGSKDDIVRSIRMLVAQHYYRGTDNENTLKPLIQAAMFLDSFSDTAPDSLEYVESMQTRRREVIAFYQSVMDIRRDDTFFWQRVYALAGINCDTKRTTFFEHIKSRLGVTSRAPAVPHTTPD